MLYAYSGRLVRLVLCLGALGVMPLFAQTRQAEEARREAWQKVDQIFTAMEVQPGATVADVGAGDGFFPAGWPAPSDRKGGYSQSTSTRRLSLDFGNVSRMKVFEM